MSTPSFAGGERARPEWLRRHPRGWVLAVLTVCFGAFMSQLDASVVALTYHAIGADFGAPLAAVQWVTLSYLIALAALLIPVGGLSDRLGRKRVYLWGFGGFSLASLGCAFAPSLPALVLLRAVQGVGASMVQANSVALVTTSAPRARLRSALGMQAAAQAIGLAVGPTVGGLVVQTIGWRWVFALNVPIGVVAVVAGRYLLPRTRLSTEPHGHGGLRGVLAIQPVRRGLVGAMLAYLLLFGPIVLVPTVLQTHGISALGAGLLVAALPVGFALGAAVADRLLPRGWTVRARCLAGLTLAGAGLLALLIAGVRPGASAAALAAVGVGLGVFTPANNATIMGAVGDRVAALTGGLISTARAVGTAIGTAIVAGTLSVDGTGRAAAAALVVAVALAFATVPSGRAHAAVDATTTVR